MENSVHSAEAAAYPNIAFIKYWGNRDEALRLPANGSISMNLSGLITRTRIRFDPFCTSDTLFLNDLPAGEDANRRISAFLNHIRKIAGSNLFAQIESWNNFPTGAGIASSASAFAALTLAATHALSINLSESDLSRLARLGSGSACRSIPGGFVEWVPGSNDQSSYAFSIAPPEHWELVDCIAVLNSEHKRVGSTQGHSFAWSSPLQVGRVEDTPRRLEICRLAIQRHDFESLAKVVELDSNLMHAVMMTSTPPLLYWEPVTVQVMRAVQEFRSSGYPVCYTIDAGPNVHVLTLANYAERVQGWFESIPGIERVIRATPGGPAHLIE